MSVRPLSAARPVTLYRLTKAVYAASAASGAGGLAAAGRWHEAGQPVVYLADAFSLAVLELFVHTGRAGLAVPLSAFEIAVPEAIPIEELAPPPRGWWKEPPSRLTQRVGSAWLAGASAPLLRLPSRLSPFEWNYILNPVHPLAARLSWSPPRSWAFDARMGR